MPSDIPTIVLIQREINEVAQREKELQLLKNNLQSSETNNNNINNNDHSYLKNGDHKIEKPSAAPVLLRGYSIPPAKEQTNGYRKFQANPNVRGFMQRFIKARGKLSTNKTIESPTNEQPKWAMPEIVAESMTRIVKTGEPVQFIRKGYVPVEERMKQELIDIRSREAELKTKRKSLSDFHSLDEYESPEPKSNLRPVKSMMQLYNPDEDEEEIILPQPTLKPARSLAELCDVSDEELNTPSLLIKQFESLIKKNQKRK